MAPKDSISIGTIAHFELLQFQRDSFSSHCDTSNHWQGSGDRGANCHRCWKQNKTKKWHSLLKTISCWKTPYKGHEFALYFLKKKLDIIFFLLGTEIYVIKPEHGSCGVRTVNEM